MNQSLVIINGPNLNLLGKREIDIYGSTSFEDYFHKLQIEYPDVNLIYFQSNHEGAIIDKLHEHGFSIDGIILNAGAYSHTSIAIADAVKAISQPVVEVHISDINAREEFRKFTYLENVCVHTITGKGLDGYKMALQYILSMGSIA